MSKMKEYSKAYIMEAINLALSNITIKPCKKCGHPVHCGFVCYSCMCESPTDLDQEESFLEAPII